MDRPRSRATAPTWFSPATSGRLHVFHRDRDDQGKLAPGTPGGKDVHDTLVGLLA